MLPRSSSGRCPSNDLLSVRPQEGAHNAVFAFGQLEEAMGVAANLRVDSRRATQGPNGSLQPQPHDLDGNVFMRR